MAEAPTLKQKWSWLPLHLAMEFKQRKGHATPAKIPAPSKSVKSPSQIQEELWEKTKRRSLQRQINRPTYDQGRAVAPVMNASAAAQGTQRSGQWAFLRPHETDFNDLKQLDGIGRQQEQLMFAVKKGATPPSTTPKTAKPVPMSAEELAKKTQEFDDLLKKGKFNEAAKKYWEMPENKRGDIIKQMMDRYQNLADKLKAREVQRPGNKPWNYHFGEVAHRDIADYYRAAHPNDPLSLNKSHVKTIAQLIKGQKVTKVTDSGRPPDIVNRATLELYEIKTKGEAAQGRKQRDAYLAAFKALNVNMKPGNSADRGVNGMKDTEGGFIVFYSPEPGLVLYERRVKTQPEAVPDVAPMQNLSLLMMIIAFLGWLYTLPQRAIPVPVNPGFSPFSYPQQRADNQKEEQDAADS